MKGPSHLKRYPRAIILSANKPNIAIKADKSNVPSGGI